ncbi:MAG TPA: hypothetical protein PLY57_02405 [Deltaproteobacteria bacterium]|nr:hypothetical protein [Deltaproteobacteria bacterium]
MLRSFVKHVSFPFFANREGLKGLMQEVRSLEDSQFWPAERIMQMQQILLKKVMIHAYEHTKFYRRRFQEAGFNPYTFRHPDALRSLPALTSEEVRDNLPDMVADNHAPGDLHLSQTGGAAGLQMRFYHSSACLAGRQAAMYRFEKWTGWDFGEPVGVVLPIRQDRMGYPTVKFLIKNELFRRQTVFPAAVIDDAACEDFLHKIVKKRPTLIRAFSSPLHDLARFVQSSGWADIPLKAVVSTGEPLYPHQRRSISRAFNCPVFDSYQSRGVGPIAQECEVHQGMHINAECLYIEVDGPNGYDEHHGRTGGLIVTDLLNFGMPLIRYSTGDESTLVNRTCPCGRGLPLLEQITGRSGDMLVSPEGRCVVPAALSQYLIGEAPDLVGQIQVIQDRIDHLTIRMTKDPAPTPENMQHQKTMIEQLFGPGMRVHFEIVDEMPREKSGKYLFTRRLIPLPARMAEEEARMSG